MAETTEPATQEDDWIQANAGITYTRAFQIRQRMYRFMDWDLPFRHGLAVEQFVTFIVVTIASIIFFGLTITPLAHLITGSGVPFQFALLFIFGPPILAAQRIVANMPNEKSISGYLMSALNYYLDDEWHRRGTPIPPEDAPSQLVFSNYMRVWSVDPQFAQLESPDDLPASQLPNAVYRPYPDEPISAIDEVSKEKKALFESDEEFYGRLRGSLDGDELIENQKSNSIIYRAPSKKGSNNFDYLKGHNNV